MTIIGVIFSFWNEEGGEMDSVQFHLKFYGKTYSAVKRAENKIKMMTKQTVKNKKMEYYCNK